MVYWYVKRGWTKKNEVKKICIYEPITYYSKKKKRKIWLKNIALIENGEEEKRTDIHIGFNFDVQMPDLC
jgi:hypothetical protein